MPQIRAAVRSCTAPGSGPDPAPAPYVIRVKGHLGATLLAAFLGIAPQRYGGQTVLTGRLDLAALCGVLA